MAGYRIARAFERIPEITGLDLVMNGGKWQGGYYLNGDKHPYRRDKLKVVEWKNGIWLFEEGGEGMSLENWLQRYGGAKDYWEALDIIDGKSAGFVFDREFRKKETGLQYVDPSALLGAKQYDLGKCSLFRWMCRMFPEDKVREAWDLYNVTTDSHGNAVYWYVDQNGKILYDKRISYKEDGHRDKNFFPGRQYRVADGYTGKCYFGSCLPDDGRKVYVCESEKSALLGYLYWGRRFVATGGKGNLRGVEPGMFLVPDMDARMEWEEKGEVYPWWEKWGIPIADIPEKADIGDMIEWKRTAFGN